VGEVDETQVGVEDKGTSNNKDKIQGFFAPLRMTNIFLTSTALVTLF